MKLLKKIGFPTFPASRKKQAFSSSNGDVLASLDLLHKQIATLDNKLERAWLQIEFLRTRTSVYLGDEIALTNLVDETPIFINTNDFGCPMNFLEGGRYEEENLRVLQSFVTDRSVFLDIGANLGYFTLQIAPRLSRGGKVHAFEPHPKVFDLFNRSVFLNGHASFVETHNFCLSDHHGPIELQYPIGHLGGGHISSGGADGSNTLVKSEMKTLDAVVGPDFSCDLVKIDVEGHELAVLRGMRRTLENSPSIKILLEKLSANSGIETETKAYFDEFGLALYGVGANATLIPLPSLADFKAWGGYILAVRPELLDGVMDRNRFSTYPRQHTIGGNSTAVVHEDGSFLISGDGDLFHGPYWFLPRGTWRLKIHGSIDGALRITIAERFGVKVLELDFENKVLERDFICEHDLIKFECVARSAIKGSAVRLSRLEFIRLG